MGNTLLWKNPCIHTNGQHHASNWAHAVKAASQNRYNGLNGPRSRKARASIQAALLLTHRQLNYSTDLVDVAIHSIRDHVHGHWPRPLQTRRHTQKDRYARVLDVFVRLILGCFANEPLFVGERYDRRRHATADVVADDLDTILMPHAHAAVRGAEVYSNRTPGHTGRRVVQELQVCPDFTLYVLCTCGWSSR